MVIGHVSIGRSLVRKESFAFFQNKECEYFPCHDTTPVEYFNCLFCYCPLYHYRECGGVFKVLESGVKDCSLCTKNHDKDSWKFVRARIREEQNIKVKFSRIDLIGQNGGDGEHYE